ncbi:hypothetical protein [Tomitella fengzijianii]|uniref:Uncharacterized protein n=1 Tax=Tomitella fengzijianii TaxID=2597660 RepID=A0A516X4H0_9ACTN|nr:hypothetical protein [Tomitella fengzijianii]QDQ97979.1 hypothetical protein FO059_12460 [Tomitella fengzijianii]
MAKPVRLDRRGVGEVLKFTARDAVDALAAQVADNVAVPAKYNIPADAVTVRRYRTDRGAASVDINHNAATRAQITDGILTRAAAAAGLQVTSRR